MANNLSKTYNDNFGQIADWIGDLQESQRQTANKVSSLQAQYEQIKTSIDSGQALSNSTPQRGFFGSQNISNKAPALVIEQQNAVMKFYLLIRQFVLNAKPWTQAFRYQTKVDERYDMTLVSQRVYGHREEFIAVQAAANLDSTEQLLEEQLLILPSAEELHEIKTRSGYLSIDTRRVRG